MIEILFMILSFIVAKLLYDNLMLRLENDNIKRDLKSKLNTKE